MERLEEYVNNHIGPWLYGDIERLTIDCKDVLGYVPESQMDILKNTNNLIEEGLIKSHDASKYQEKIRELFNDVIFEETTDKSSKDDVKSFFIIFSNDKEAQQFYNPPKSEIGQQILSLSRFFNYKTSEKDGNKVLVEPVYPKSANKLLYKNHNVCYHLCFKENTDKILNTGLRCKNNTRRAIPSRIYLYCNYDITKSKNDFTDFIRDLNLTRPISEYDLLRINLNNVHLDRYEFYQDDLMESKYAIFTYNNIDKKLIKKVSMPKFIIDESMSIFEGKDDSPLQKFFNKHGIVPEKISPSSKVNQIGFSEKEQAWYGWSHRAIYGFKIGVKSGPGKVGYETLKQENGPLEAKSLDDCKKMAIAFAKEIA